MNLSNFTDDNSEECNLGPYSTLKLPLEHCILRIVELTMSTMLKSRWRLTMHVSLACLLHFSFHIYLRIETKLILKSRKLQYMQIKNLKNDN